MKIYDTVVPNIIEILAGIIKLGLPRRVDGEFYYNGRNWLYSSYIIKPSSGEPIIRIDIKASPGSSQADDETYIKKG